MPVIPPRSNRKEPADYDRHLYRERHLVECFINKIKHYRRIFSRFEKLDTSTWASCTSPPLSSGYGEMSTEPSSGLIGEKQIEAVVQMFGGAATLIAVLGGAIPLFSLLGLASSG